MYGINLYVVGSIQEYQADVNIKLNYSIHLQHFPKDGKVK